MSTDEEGFPAPWWRRLGGAEDEGAHRGIHSLSLSLIAMAPMLLAYELSLRPGAPRNLAELWTARGFAPLGEWAWLGRGLLLVLALGAALLACRRRELELRPALSRVLVEGLVGAVLLGPLLVWLYALLAGGESTTRLAGPVPGELPSLGLVAFHFGSAAWEELFFRVAGYSLIYFLARRVATFFGASARGAAWAGEAVALLGSALVFALFHLEAFTGWLAEGGEPFHRGLFLWRFLAGLFLGALFRWRGPGVCAWSHGLFNAALALGVGPRFQA